MAKTLRIDYQGSKVLTELEAETRRALEKSSTPIERETQTHVPKDDGDAIKSVSTRITDQSLYITAGGKKAPHFFLLEYGTKPRQQETTGRFTGSMPAYAPLRKAGEKARGIVRKNLIEEWNK
jgi:hypothetical protein